MTNVHKTKKKLRVLQISTKYSGGGAERCSRELSEELIKRGHDVTMWTGAIEHEIPEYVSNIRSNFERLLWPVNFIFPVSDWRHIGSRQRIKHLKAEFDVVHLHNIHSNWISISAVSKLCDIMPVVWTLHDEWGVTGGVPYDLSRNLSQREINLLRVKGLSLTPLVATEWRARCWRHFMMKHPLNTQRIICPSRYLASLANESDFTNNAPVTYLPNGCRLNRLTAPSSEEAKRSWNIPLEQQCILLIASDMRSPYKGIHHAIEALNTLFNKGIEARVLLLGKNTHLIRDQIKIPGSKITTGYASTDSELIKAYRASDVTLIPSVADNFPYTILESFASETPVIGFDLCGITEMLKGKSSMGENGILIKPFDIKAFANSIELLLTDKALRDSIGHNARCWVEDTCDMDDYVSTIEDIYQKAMMAR